MIPKKCKRLAEVDFPIAEVSKHAVREKSIRHGHPSTLHLWWARRPLASCRAVLLGLLLPDPCDPHCPEAFKGEARKHLSEVQNVGQGDDELRRGLLKFIGDFASWDLSSNQRYLDASRGLVRAAYPEELPLVVDPFAGGGAIPLEALRLGCEAFASDLNPVACLILKVMLEDIPRHGPGLAEELRQVGGEIKKQAGKELEEFYPPDPDNARPIAYLWARTVRCETCGAEIPLARSFWLSKKASRRWALRYSVVRDDSPPRLEFEVFQPSAESDVPSATVTRARATCRCCNITLGPDRVRAQLVEQRGGADVQFDERGNRTGGARLLAVVTVRPGEAGRSYRLPTGQDYAAVWKSQKRLDEVCATPLDNGLSPVPDVPTPKGGGAGAGRAFSLQRYGMRTFGDLFTARQKLATLTLATLVRSAAGSLPTAVPPLLALCIGKTADLGNAAAPWKRDAECPVNLLGSQRIRTPWDWAEAATLGDASGSFTSAVERSAAAIEAAFAQTYGTGDTALADATDTRLPSESANIWFTDPPYYDAIPYADLSDFFFVWLKRTLPNHALLRDPFDHENPLTPKAREIVQDESRTMGGRVKDKSFYEEMVGMASTEGRRILEDNGIASVIFAHKTTEGWEALLSGLAKGGWTITGSWPVATEMPHRPRARESAALATSVHLICRPREENAIVGDWMHVYRELPLRVRDWMNRLQREEVRGADLVFACIGPALEIYSRYSKVVDAEEREIPLGGDPQAKEPHKRGYLAYVWEVVGRLALEEVLGTDEARAANGAAGVLEEDSRLTALFLWTRQSTAGADAGDKDSPEEEDQTEDEDGDEDEDVPKRKKTKGLTLVYDIVRRFAQPLGIHLPDWEGRIIETEKGVVRLLAVSERAKQLFGQEGAQALVAQLERGAAGVVQLSLFPEEERTQPPEIGVGGGRRMAERPTAERGRGRKEATTLDRVHAAMLLQKGGRTNALRALVKAEQERGPTFMRLANNLSALYPRGSEERRLLEAMLQAMPR